MSAFDAQFLLLVYVVCYPSQTTTVNTRRRDRSINRRIDGTMNATSRSERNTPYSTHRNAAESGSSQFLVGRLILPYPAITSMGRARRTYGTGAHNDVCVSAEASIPSSLLLKKPNMCWVGSVPVFSASNGSSNVVV